MLQTLGDFKCALKFYVRVQKYIFRFCKWTAIVIWNDIKWINPVKSFQTYILYTPMYFPQLLSKYVEKEYYSSLTLYGII